MEGFEGTRTYSGSVEEAEVRIEQDRLTGTLAYTLTDPVSPAGKYRFTVTGIVEGDGVHGYWLGTRDGKDILVKSSRLNARLIRAGQTDAAARE